MNVHGPEGGKETGSRCVAGFFACKNAQACFLERQKLCQLLPWAAKAKVPYVKNVRIIDSAPGVFALPLYQLGPAPGDREGRWCEASLMF